MLQIQPRVVMRAEAIVTQTGDILGAVAFSRTGDPATGDFGDGKDNKEIW